MLSVLETKLVLVRSVEIHVQEYVGLIPTALPQTTMQSASAILATLAMPSLPARELPHHPQECQLRDPIPATPLLVGQMLFAQKETVQDPVNAFLTTLETPILPVALSVQSMQTVHPTEHVSNFTVWIHALDSVEPMLSAESLITSQLARAREDILVILSLHAGRNR